MLAKAKEYQERARGCVRMAEQAVTIKTKQPPVRRNAQPHGADVAARRRRRDEQIGALDGSLAEIGRRQLTNKTVNKAPGSKLKVPASKKKKTAGRMAKLKSSSWYEGAARSIRISSRRAQEKGDEFDR
jgi:hypothetical protein